MTDNSQQHLQQQILNAIDEQKPLHIFAGKSKDFYGHKINADDCCVAHHSGIIQYDPSELVLTAKAGTPLIDIEKALAEHNQELPFEAPIFSLSATLGGCVAAGLSGPSRPFSGAVRDYVLGCTLINGRGEIVEFGGQVMKNVAGYDVSKLVTGSLGTLGLLLSISLKVLPKAATSLTLKFEMNESAALKQINHILSSPYPITASCICQQKLFIRLAGTQASVDAARKKLGGDVCNNDMWALLQHQKDDFFNQDTNYWRLSLPPASAAIKLAGEQLIEWHGAQRWIKTNESANKIFALAKSLGGHACLFKYTQAAEEIFQPLDKNLFALQKNIKQAMDPNGIFNIGKMYKEF